MNLKNITPRVVGLLLVFSINLITTIAICQAQNYNTRATPQTSMQQLNTHEKESQRIVNKKEINHRRTSIATIVLSLLLIAISLGSIKVWRRLNRQLISHQQEINLKNTALNKLKAQKTNLLLEKEWLMKEIHHRVKNNLQIVISLLNTQSAYLKNDAAFKAVKESQHRMQSISLIHQKLYQSENLAIVDMRPYITELIAYLKDSFDPDDRITFDLAIDDAEFDVVRAVPIGLILNEAITNALKYAFPDKVKGLVTVALTNINDGNYVLLIRDNGIGDSKVNQISVRKTLGMSLMTGLSRQLKGLLEITSDHGLKITVTFKYEQADNINIRPFTN